MIRCDDEEKDSVLDRNMASDAKDIRGAERMFEFNAVTLRAELVPSK